MKGDLWLWSHGSEGILQKWFSKQLPPPHQSPERNPSPNCHPRPGPRSRGQMASPKGQVLFSLVIPRPPPSSAKHLSDRNLAVMLAQCFTGNLSKVSIHHVTQRQTGSLPVSEGSSHSLERRGSVHRRGATGWYLRKRGRDEAEVSRLISYHHAVSCSTGYTNTKDN